MQDVSPVVSLNKRSQPKTPSLSIQLPSSPPLTDPGDAMTENRSSHSRSAAYPTPLQSASPADTRDIHRPSHHRYSASLELRRLFDDDEAEAVETGNKERERGSSVGMVLQPAFESQPQTTPSSATKTRSRVVTRSAASFDLAKWLQENFKHTPPPHSNVTPSQSLLSLHSLLLQHLPAPCVPTREALPLAVLGAFPAAKWEWPATSGDPPLIRGLVWNVVVSEDGSRSPDIHGTPARSVLDEFAELAAMSEKTPVRLGRSQSRKRKASKSPETASAPLPSTRSGKAKGKATPARSRARRTTTPDGLHGLLAAAAHVEGSPIAPTAAKRRRTVNGQDLPKPQMTPERKQRAFSTAQDALGLTTVVENAASGATADEDSAVPLALAAIGIDPIRAGMTLPPLRAGTLSLTGDLATYSTVARPVLDSPDGRASQSQAQSSNGQSSSVPLTKPPHPYHEMIRYAIETAPGQKLQLAQIYKSIAERFPFFKMLDEQKTAGWQNSIRHNLSLKKMFVRTTKPEGYDEDVTGKGGWWTVQPGVPDEGRPGRKAKAKKLKAEQAAAAAAWAPPPLSAHPQQPYIHLPHPQQHLHQASPNHQVPLHHQAPPPQQVSPHLHQGSPQPQSQSYDYGYNYPYPGSGPQYSQ